MSFQRFGPFLLALLLVPPIHAQQKKPAPKALAAGSDQLGLTCGQILQMSSSDWVAKFQQKVTAPEETLRAISSFGKCYDARTDRLAAALGRSGRGPLMGARGDFQDFDKRLRDFALKALAATDPPADAVKIACSNLYEKRFRYEFYEAYEPKPAAGSPGSAKENVPAAVPTSTPPPAPNQASGSGAASSAPPAADVPPITKAKNRFGELLGLLPDEKAHALHAAFGDVFGNNQVSEATRLEVYQYAIYLLEPPSAAPFAPPPF